MRARTHSLTFTRTHTHTRANELPGLHCWFSQDKLKRLVNGHQPSAGGSGVSRGSRVGGRTNDFKKNPRFFLEYIRLHSNDLI